MKSFMLKKENVKRKWYLVDANDQTLGRLSVKIAGYLTGKNKPDYTPHVDSGDEVVVINAAKIRVTGRKMEQKLYTSYSGYPGGLKSKNLKTMMDQKPEEVIRHAVKGMLPKNKLGSRMINRLKVYTGSDHPHASQKPENISL